MDYLILDSWENNKNLKSKLKEILKNDNEFGWNYPKKIKVNEKLIFLLNNEKLLSVIHIMTKNNILEFSFSYTPINERRKGYNKNLRLFIINYYQKENINKFTSTPFKNANSIPLLESLGFEKKKNRYILFTG